MVKIIKGMYIRTDKNGHRQRITEKDGPQTFDKDEEARLVSEGVAKYVVNEESAEAKKAESEKVIRKEERPPVVAKPEKAKQTKRKSKSKSAEKETVEEEPPKINASELIQE